MKPLTHHQLLTLSATLTATQLQILKLNTRSDGTLSDHGRRS